MKLLFFSTVYPTPWEPSKGPANKSTVESLRELGHDVRVVAPVPWPERFRRKKREAPPGDFPVYWYSPIVLRRFYHHPLWLSVRKTFERLTSDFRPDAVLAFWTHPDGTVALRYGRALGIPTAIIVGGSDVMLLPQKPSRRLRVANTLKLADHVFAVGVELQRRVIGLGVTPENVSNFYCGVDLTAFAPGERGTARERLNLPLTGKLILWIGAMREVKAPERVLAAAKELFKTDPQLQLAMLGDGELRSALDEMVRSDPILRGRVHFPGSVSHDTLPLWYQAADIFVLPSRSEGVPNVLLEAMAVGLPFVASDVGSIKDLLPFGPSEVVPEGDLNAFTTAIQRVLGRHPDDTFAPVRYDRLDGARHLIQFLQPSRA